MICSQITVCVNFLFPSSSSASCFIFISYQRTFIDFNFILFAFKRILFLTMLRTFEYEKMKMRIHILVSTFHEMLKERAEMLAMAKILWTAMSMQNTQCVCVRVERNRKKQVHLISPWNNIQIFNIVWKLYFSSSIGSDFHY